MNDVLMKDFVAMLTEKIQEQVGDTYNVSTHEVLKVNDTKLIGLTMYQKSSNVSPNIYLEPYYEQYNEGRKLEAIVKEIIDITLKAGENPFTNQYIGSLHEILADYDRAKDKLIIRVMNIYSNGEYLKDKCWQRFGNTDLAIVYFYLVSHDHEGIGSIAITNDIFKHWNVNLEQIHENAIENMQKEFPLNAKPLYDALMEMKDMTDFGEFMNLPEIPNDILLYIMTNSQGINGANVLLYPDALKSLCNQLSADELVIIPSSIHELLVMKYSNQSKEDLQSMVQEVNSTCVQPSEVLSSNIYKYSLDADTVTIWE